MILVSLLFGCPTESDTDTEPEAYRTPWEAGDAVAGTDTFTVGGDPELPGQVWYPADDGGFPALYDGLDLGEAREGAPARCSEPVPVVMFSHGNGGLRYQSTFLTEHLATRGYLVAAPDHVGNTTFDMALETGDVAVRRPLDIQRAFDHIVARSADASDPLFGCVDPDAGYAVMGHSFGGYTAFALAGARIDLEELENGCPGNFGFLCGMETYYADQFPADDGTALIDDRVWAAIPLTPAGEVALRDGLPEITVPTQVLGGEIDELTTMQFVVQPMYDRLQASPSYLGVLQGTGHFSFTDFCISGSACFGGGIPHDESKRLINGLVTSFLDDTRGIDGASEWVGFEDENVVWTAR